MEAEVVLLDRLGEREPGDLESGLDAALLLGRHLFLEQVVQEREIGGLLGLGLPGDRVEHLGRGRKASVRLHPSTPCVCGRLDS